MSKNTTEKLHAIDAAIEALLSGRSVQSAQYGDVAVKYNAPSLEELKHEKSRLERILSPRLRFIYVRTDKDL